MNDRWRSTAPEREPSGDGRGRRPHPSLSGHAWLITLLVLFLFNLLFYLPFLTASRPVPRVTLTYSAFLTQVRADNVATAQVAAEMVSGDFKAPYRDPATHTSYTRYTATLLPVTDPDLVPLLEQHGVQLIGEVTSPPLWLAALGLLVQALPVLLLIGLFAVGARVGLKQQQGIFGFGQSKAKLYTEERPSTTFADVAGIESAKAELREVVDFLRDPAKYRRLGARIPKGVLLVGPPGTGKTLLARAVAGEARVPFLSISATEFVEMFVGVGASRVRDLFDKAKSIAPSIVFIDEIDAIGGQRGGGFRPAGTNDEREQTLNQLLVSMDGFEPNEAVIVLAATNRPDVLDPALLRPGRFDRQVTVDLPDRAGREAIVRIHTKHMPLAPTVDLGALARATPGMSGADLANLANEAALSAARRGADAVTPADFEEALDRITLGAPGAALMDEEERRTVAYHESGHALVAYFLPNMDPIHRVTITPRGRSLGVTQFRPIDDRRNYRRDYLLDRMAVGLGGRAAEELACGEITSGAQNDLQEVTRMARTMVTQLGMADEIGPEYFGGSADGVVDRRLYVPWEPKEYSEETARHIDEAVHRLIEEAHRRARSILTAHRATLDAVAAALLHEEALDRDQLAAVVEGRQVQERQATAEAASEVLAGPLQQCHPLPHSLRPTSEHL
jgi:cell division protease FtsH